MNETLSRLCMVISLKYNKQLVTVNNCNISSKFHETEEINIIYMATSAKIMV